MTDGQLAVTSGFLRATGLPGAETAIAGLSKYFGPIGMVATGVNGVAQTISDIQNDVPPLIAITGAVINGTLTIGAGALTAPAGPEASVKAGAAIGAVLPSNATMGQAAWDEYQNWYDAHHGM